MNYEERYKEAIYLLKELRPKISDYYREKLDGLFPEIAESEDEKIRKVLIGWINLEPSISFGDSFGGFSKEQIIAWLEKQGEKSWSEKDEKFVVDTMNFLYRAKKEYAQTSRLEECIAWLKSLKEKLVVKRMKKGF